MTNTNPKSNQAPVTKDQDLQDKPWRKYKMKFQPGQTKYVAEMTQEEIDAHNDKMEEIQNRAYEEKDEEKSNKLDRQYFCKPNMLNFLKNGLGLDYVKEHYDYSPAIKAYGERWLTEEILFGDQYET